MDARELERMLRRVVREELAALARSGALADLCADPPAREPGPAADPAKLEHPYLLSEPELRQAERLLSEEERPILRQRVYAARLEKMGNHAQARKFRRKADRMEERLKAS